MMEKCHDSRACLIERITVSIDPELEDLIPGFLQNRSKDLQMIQDALKDGDADTIRRIGHKIKGSAGGYGFDEMSLLGKDLEEAGKNMDLKMARSSTEKLKEYLEHIEIVYE